MKPSDHRQYKLMEEYTKLSTPSVDELGKIVNALRSLLLVLESKDEKWSSRFMAQWWLLEESLAIMRDQSIDRLEPPKNREISMILESIRRLVQEKLGEYNEDTISKP